MVVASFVVAILSALFTAANLYFNHLRTKRALYLVAVRAGRTHMGPTPIALMNASSEDVIITSVTFFFLVKGGATMPAQTIEWNDADSFLIPKGKGMTAKVTLTDKTTRDFVISGTKNSSLPDLYDHHYGYWISWIQGSGDEIQKAVVMGKMGLRETGEIGMIHPTCMKADLYKCTASAPSMATA